MMLGIKKSVFRGGHFQSPKLKKEATDPSEKSISSSDYTAAHFERE
jgi:hypothetical protein